MKRCNNCCQYNLTEIYSSAENGCHKKYKRDLDHLRGLNSHQGKFRAITCSGQNKNCCQKHDTDSRIDPCKILEKFHLADHNRDHQRHCTSARNDQKLLIGRGNIQPAQHYKSNA